MRILDGIRHYGYRLPGIVKARFGNSPGGTPPHLAAKLDDESRDLLRLLERYPPGALEVSNVAEYAAEVMKEQGEFVEEAPWELPCVMPPFQNTWIEYRITEDIRRTIRSKSPDQGTWHWKAVGALLLTFETSEDDSRLLREMDPSFEPKVSLEVHTFLESESLTYPNAHVRLHLDADGRASRACAHRSLLIDEAALARMSPSEALKATDAMRAVTFTLMRPIFLGIAFSHCKNVAVVDEVDASSVVMHTGESKKRRSEPLIRYKVLVIDPMKSVLAAEANPVRDGVACALHICRGHFKTYSDERPLFGKLSGSFWIPAHIRGEKRRGLVMKDYAVRGLSKANPS